MNHDASVYISYLGLAYVAGISLPIIIYSIYLLHLHWNQKWLIQRDRLLLLALFITSSTVSLIYFPMSWSLNIQYGIDPLQWPTLYYSIATWIYSVSLYATIIMYFAKVYVLYFHYRFARVLSASDRISLSAVDLIRSNFYVQYRNSLGNSNNVFVLACMLIVVLSSLRVCLELYTKYGNLFIIVDAISIAPWITASIMLWRRFPANHYVFGIQHELRFFFKSIAILLLVSAPGISLYYILSFDFIVLLLFTLQTYYLILTYSIIIYPFRLHTCNNSEMIRVKPVRKQLSWQLVASTMQGYDEFISFLEAEFSAESLIFVTEYAQLLNVIRNEDRFVIKFEEHQYQCLNIRVAEDLPQSILVQSFKQELEKTEIMIQPFYKVTGEIHKKYIVSGSPVEINVDGKLRKELGSYFKKDRTSTKVGSDNVIEILKAFDKAYKQIDQILEGSFMRFKSRYGSEFIHSKV